MSNENDFDDEDGNDGEGIKNLRKQYNDMKKQNDELVKELGTFRSERRVSTVSDILKAKGVPSSAAKFYTGDDTSEDAVGKWLEENADVFNVSGASSSGEIDANAQSAQRISAASFGQPSDNNAKVPQGQAVMGDPAEMLRFVQTAPYEELVRLGYMPQTGTLFNPKR